jgi:hypothetical protein
MRVVGVEFAALNLNKDIQYTEATGVYWRMEWAHKRA